VWILDTQVTNKMDNWWLTTFHTIPVQCDLSENGCLTTASTSNALYIIGLFNVSYNLLYNLCHNAINAKLLVITEITKYTKKISIMLWNSFVVVHIRTVYKFNLIETCYKKRSTKCTIRRQPLRLNSETPGGKYDRLFSMPSTRCCVTSTCRSFNSAW